MKKIENAELVEVAYSDDNKKVTLTFLDAEAGEIREVSFNKQVYKDGKYVDDAAKTKQVDEWCHDYFDTKFENLSNCIGVKRDIYAYEKFSSVFEVEQIEKFTEKDKGKIYQTVVKEVLADDLFIRIRYEINGKTYESKQSLGKYVESMNKYYPDPVKKVKELAKFEEKFGIPVTRKDELVGEKLIVEVKCAFKTYYYGDIKKMPK